jgi:hypothetical protein
MTGASAAALPPPCPSLLLLLLLLSCRYISLVIVQSDVFTQDHHALTYTNGEATA